MGVARGETVDVTREGGRYVARDEETGVASQGGTMGDAIANLGEALDLYLDLAGDDPPEDPPDVPWFDGRQSEADRRSSLAGRPGRTAGRVTCSGEAVVDVLRDRGYDRAGRSERHARLRYRHPGGEVRTVVVPLLDDLAAGTLRAVAAQAGAQDARQFLDSLDRGT